jgi:O-antigen ligase
VALVEKIKTIASTIDPTNGMRKYTVALLLPVIFSVFENVLRRQSTVFQEFEITVLQTQIIILICLVVWYVFFLYRTFSLNDLPLVGLLGIAISVYFICYAATWRKPDAISLLAGATLGRGVQFFRESSKPHAEIGKFLTGLVILLGFSSCWHLDMAGSYHGPRWMGLWDNPNTYGMLMGAGGLLAIGLLAANAKLKIKNSKTNWFLGIAVFLLGIGLLMSYSRGAWLATAIGVLYLAWSYGKLKWRYVLPVAAVAAVVVLFLWGSTPDSAPWYVKRADLGRPSAQHRATAWRAGLEMMRDHPFGVGWNNAVSVYAKDYSPPEDGAAAITTNDYLMLGTQLGIPALLCFVAYVGLCFRGKCSIKNEEGRIQAACRAGALVFVVAFWFDGGLFKLPTAALFWVLLELGVAQQMPDPASVGKLVAANH